MALEMNCGGASAWANQVAGGFGPTVNPNGSQPSQRRSEHRNRGADTAIRGLLAREGRIGTGTKLFRTPDCCKQTLLAPATSS